MPWATIEQNGFVVYQKEVPPCPFRDYRFAVGRGGVDSHVSVKEADGWLPLSGALWSATQMSCNPRVEYDFCGGS
ncbi:fimbria/pilus outer membrane usher protein [Shigella flexneri]